MATMDDWAGGPRVGAPEVPRPQEQEAARGRARPLVAAWRTALIAFVVTRLALTLVGLLAEFYIVPLMARNMTRYAVAADTHLPGALWLMWKRFDSGFYIDLAIHGYWGPATLHARSNWVFYPLYPLLMRAVAALFGHGATGYIVAGIVVANAATLIALVYLYLLAWREFGERVAVGSVFLLALFPSGFYLSAIYPHSLTLACSVACLYYARTRRWWLAGLCGGLAALTRAQGLLLLIPLAWEYWQAISDRYAPLPETDAATDAAMDGEEDAPRRAPRSRGRSWLASRLHGPRRAARDSHAWTGLAGLALTPMGTILFMAYAGIKTGDYLAASHDEVYWGRHFAYPWTLLLHSLRHPSRPSALDWNFWLLNNGMALAFLALTVWAFRRLPIIYALYTLVMVLSPLSTNSMQSLSRYYVVVFPAFLLLALWSSRDTRPDRAYALVALFAALQAVFMTFFVLGLPTIA